MTSSYQNQEIKILTQTKVVSFKCLLAALIWIFREKEWSDWTFCYYKTKQTRTPQIFLPTKIRMNSEKIIS